MVGRCQPRAGHRRGSDDAVSEDEVVWPTGMSDQDPGARERPLVFSPEGFLVAILEDADQAEQARMALAEAGFAETNLRVYTSQQILDSWERFQAERSLAQRVAGAVTDDPDTIESSCTSGMPARAASPCGSTSLMRPTPNGPCGPWPITRSSTSATTATTARTTSTFAEASTRPEGDDLHDHNQ
jgi:hypothetical protein